MNQTAIKYRIYPSSHQKTLLNATLSVCCEVYNSLVHWRRHDYEITGKSPTCFTQQKSLPLWKKEHAQLSLIYSQALQNVAKRVDLAYEAFFRRMKEYKQRKAAGLLQPEEKPPGRPRTKGKGHYDSITYPQDVGFHVKENSIHLSKIGDIKAAIHRCLPGLAKTCTVRKQAGKWFACIVCEIHPVPLPVSSEQVGVDMGVAHFAILDDGQGRAEFVKNPRFFRKEEKNLAKAQRKADLLKHARSKEHKEQRRKAYKVVARIHERIRNKRHDFVHQISRKIVNKYGFIAVEALHIDTMLASPKPKPDAANPGDFLPNGAGKKARLNKSIADAAWSMFRAVLTYKAESAGRIMVAVCPAYTSQDCSGCGQRVPKTLQDRVHKCPCCLLVLDRDVNAARNILHKGMGLHTAPA